MLYFIVRIRFFPYKQSFCAHTLIHTIAGIVWNSSSWQAGCAHYWQWCLVWILRQWEYCSILWSMETLQNWQCLWFCYSAWIGWPCTDIYYVNFSHCYELLHLKIFFERCNYYKPYDSGILLHHNPTTSYWLGFLLR